MQPALDKLDDVSNRQEKYFYTMEVYRQYDYHPVHSMKGLLGLLIQIPFFMAAYRMLGTYELLSSVSFGPINDLYAPDGLFWGINILPFLMTLINLVSGYFYGKNLDKNERRQLVLIAGLFLILLYNKPSAMVFYWTMNNLFSIGKNWILGHKPKIPRITIKFEILRYRIFGIVLAGLFFACISVLVGREATVFKGIFIIITELIIFIQLALHFKRAIWKERSYLLGLFAVTSILINLFLILRTEDFFHEYIGQMYVIFSQLPVLLILSFFSAVEPFRENLESIYKKNKKYYDFASFGGFLLISGLIFFYSPLTMYLSDINSIPFSIGQLALWHLLYLAVLFIGGFLLYFFSAVRLKPLIALLYISAAVFAWIYTYLLPGDYGVLDVMAFTKPGRLNVFSRGFTNQYLAFSAAELILLGSALLVIFSYAIKNIKQILWLIVLLNLMTLGQTAYSLFSNEAILEGANVESAYLPANSDQVFRFSRKENIVVFMFDMLGGDLISDIIDQYPELKNPLKGFVWYPSTLSVGLATYGSLPSILAGADFTPDSVNNRNINSMDEMIKDAYSFYPKFSRDNGFDMTLVDPVYFNMDDYAHDWDVTLAESKSYMEYWLNHSSEASNLNLSMTPGAYTRMFSVVGLFRSIPHFLRPFVYLDGRWLMMNRGNLAVKHTAIHLGFMDLLDTLSHTDDGAPVFKFINSKLSHNPWAIDKNLKLQQTASEEFVLDTEYNVYVPEDDSVYRTAARTLFEVAAFMSWLEKEGIRDQTKVIIVSDHGYTGVHRHWSDNPVLYDSDGKALKGTFRINSVLMVKDFENNSDFAVDKRLMSIADTPSIALSLQNNPTLGKEKSREVIVSFTSPLESDHGPDKYNISRQYSVTGDPSIADNWSLNP